MAKNKNIRRTTSFHDPETVRFAAWSRDAQKRCRQHGPHIPKPTKEELEYHYKQGLTAIEFAGYMVHKYE
jgi:hypothetical protein